MLAPLSESQSDVSLNGTTSPQSVLANGRVSTESSLLLIIHEVCSKAKSVTILLSITNIFIIAGSRCCAGHFSIRIIVLFHPYCFLEVNPSVGIEER